MDYLLNPILCTIWCSEAARNIAPVIPYAVWVVMIALLFTGLNLRGIRSSARSNNLLAGALGVVIVIFLAAAARYISSLTHGAGFFTRPFYDPHTFSPPLVLTGVSVAVLTYIGFDGISTLSEEARNPRRDILRATVLVCLITGVLASIEVYTAQLAWPSGRPFPNIDTAFSFVAGQTVASPGASASVLRGAWLFQLVNLALLVASVGSGSSAQLAAARLLYGMGRSNALPKKFFGAIERHRKIPRNNVILIGAIALAGAFVLSYQLSAEMLNFGAFIAFMGVNLAAFKHYFLRQKKTISNLVPPLAGALICFYIWLNLQTPAKIGGGLWLCLGIVYGAWKTKGFREGTILFEAPQE
ncbi:MAG: APC family permease [Terriglobia bacterium]